jgi:hypothetical protein
VEAYVRGLHDEELRTAVTAKLGECTSLRRAGEVILETKRPREAIARLWGAKDRLKELEQLKQIMEPWQCTETRWTNSLLDTLPGYVDCLLTYAFSNHWQHLYLNIDSLGVVRQEW